MNTFPHKIVNWFFNIDWHEGIFMTGPIPTLGYAFHVGMGCFITARFLGDNKENNKTILADGHEVVSRKHCPKILIPLHWNIFPFTMGQPNILIPLILLGSESKCQFASLSVVGPDGPIAVSIFKKLGLNQACADPICMPTSFVLNGGTVYIGFTWADFFAGVLSMVVDAIIGFIVGKIAGLLAKVLPKGLAKRLLGKLNLPKICRGEGGRFVSVSEKAMASSLNIVFNNLLGNTIMSDSLPVSKAIQNYIDSTSENLATEIE